MIEQAHTVLRQVYGFDQFRNQQEQAVTAVLNGQDALVIMPTGGGKSLCYQVPSLVRHGMGIVVSPLIALMQDQVEALQALGVNAAFLNSTLSNEAKQALFLALQQNKIDVLYVAPERLMLNTTLEYLKTRDISLIAIDEAHCLSQWGHDFRPDYMRLSEVKQAFPQVPLMALTATADARTQDEIVHRLQIPNAVRLLGGFDRPNIFYQVLAKNDARDQLLELLRQRRGQSGIIYCSSRKKVEETARFLEGKGYSALPYHAGMDAEVRAFYQRRFLVEDNIIMVATIAFGMGIDKPDVRFVAHMDLPKSLEAYYQETGRAGRDGEPADAWLLYGLQDVVRQVQMIDQSNASDLQKNHERQKVDALLGWCELTQCRRHALLSYFGEHKDNGCGHCDNCVTPPQTWDATEAAQKVLSAVYRTQQRYGAGYIIEILRGKNSAQVQSRGHATLTVFGIGQGMADSHWRTLIRQLVVAGYLLADSERYGVLQLTAKSRPLLKGEITFEARKLVKSVANKKRHKAAEQLQQNEIPLWESLRALRRMLADEQEVPPYVVFSDATLLSMIQLMPKTLADMASVQGVGAKKLELYGVEFLQVIAEHQDA